MTLIRLINMPFALPDKPSIALTQLKYVVERDLGNAVQTDITYLNLRFASYFGWELYWGISDNMASQSSALGDWLFRQQAFSELPDNTHEYFGRYQQHFREYMDAWSMLQERREGLGAFLDELIDEYRLDTANIVGFTSMFQQNVASIAMARRLKQRNPNLTVVLGGANCEAPMGEQIARNVAHVDFVFSGASLKSFPEFVRRYATGDIDGCHRIHGVHSRQNVDTRAVKEMGEETDVNDKVELNYDSFLESYEAVAPEYASKPVLMFETSRGCWWGEKAHCTFCGLNGGTMQYRAMAADNAIRSIRSLFRYSGRSNELMAVDNILPKEYYKAVLPYIETPGDVSLFYELKADIGDDDFQALVKGRVTHTQPGIESLATETLKLMRKGTNAFQNVQFLMRCLKFNVKPEWNLLVGFPGETEAVYRKYLRDLPKLVHLPPPSGVWPVRFDRYSPYFVQAEQYKLRLEPLDYYKLIYPFPEESLSSLAYYFQDRNIEADYMQLVGAWLPELRTPVDEWIARWSNPDAAPPQLRLADDGETLLDSRSGVLVRNKLDETERWLLAELAQPRRKGELESAAVRVFGRSIAGPLESLSMMGLIFEEGDRLLSLVERTAAVGARPSMSLVGASG